MKADTDPVTRVEQACKDLIAHGEPITFDTVAGRAGLGRATLYRRTELRAIVEEHRQMAREAFTLSGLATQIDQLRTTLTALAEKVRQHEERLRRIEGRPTTR